MYLSTFHTFRGGYHSLDKPGALGKKNQGVQRPLKPFRSLQGRSHHVLQNCLPTLKLSIGENRSSHLNLLSKIQKLRTQENIVNKISKTLYVFYGWRIPLTVLLYRILCVSSVTSGKLFIVKVTRERVEVVFFPPGPLVLSRVKYH